MLSLLDHIIVWGMFFIVGLLLGLFIGFTALTASGGKRL